MQATKWILVAVFASCALQSDGAKIPRSADKFELSLFIENGAAIAKNLFKAIDAGLNASKPNVDKILNEFAPEAKASMRENIDGARNILKDTEERVNHIFDALAKALDALKPIRPCFDKISPKAKKYALAAQKETSKAVLEVWEEYKPQVFDPLNSFLHAIKENARDFFDTKVNAVVNCLKPGRKDAFHCLEKEEDEIRTGFILGIYNFVSVLAAKTEFLSEATDKVNKKVLPILSKMPTNPKVLFVEFTDCVGRLK